MKTTQDIIAEAFQDELTKIAALPSLKGKAAPIVAGAAGWELLRRSNEDRKLGKQIRKQQSGGGLF